MGSLLFDSESRSLYSWLALAACWIWNAATTVSMRLSPRRLSELTLHVKIAPCVRHVDVSILIIFFIVVFSQLHVCEARFVRIAECLQFEEEKVTLEFGEMALIMSVSSTVQKLKLTCITDSQFAEGTSLHVLVADRIVHILCGHPVAFCSAARR